MFKKLKGTQIKFILIASLILVILATVIAVVTMNVRRANMLKSNPELAKAMTYDEVKEGEEDVEGTEGNVKFDAFFLRDLNGDGYAEIPKRCKDNIEC